MGGLVAGGVVPEPGLDVLDEVFFCGYAEEFLARQAVEVGFGRVLFKPALDELPAKLIGELEVLDDAGADDSALSVPAWAEAILRACCREATALRRLLRSKAIGFLLISQRRPRSYPASTSWPGQRRSRPTPTGMPRVLPIASRAGKQDLSRSHISPGTQLVSSMACARASAKS